MKRAPEPAISSDGKDKSAKKSVFFDENSGDQSKAVVKARKEATQNMPGEKEKFEHRFMDLWTFIGGSGDVVVDEDNFSFPILFLAHHLDMVWIENLKKKLEENEAALGRHLLASRSAGASAGTAPPASAGDWAAGRKGRKTISSLNVDLSEGDQIFGEAKILGAPGTTTGVTRSAAAAASPHSAVIAATINHHLDIEASRSFSVEIGSRGGSFVFEVVNAFTLYATARHKHVMYNCRGNAELVDRVACRTWGGVAARHLSTSCDQMFQRVAGG